MSIKITNRVEKTTVRQQQDILDDYAKDGFRLVTAIKQDRDSVVYLYFSKEVEIKSNMGPM